MQHRKTAIFLQDACLQHRFIRSRDASSIVERPERLRAVKLGLAAAIARLEESHNANHESNNALSPPSGDMNTDPSPDSLADAFGRINITERNHINLKVDVVQVVQSTAEVDLLANPAVKFVHGDIDGDVYLENLIRWARGSEDEIDRGESEIPKGLSQGDLYLCPASIHAIQGALGTVCHAVDTVIRSSSSSAPTLTPPGLESSATVLTMSATDEDVHATRAFVAIRPPGHHCGEDTPSGFCFVNNVAVGAVHAHLQHGIKRVVILDIDLHHGNGTQSIVWQINEETYRATLESEADVPPGKPGMQVYYGSVHDVLSYPCEDGKAALVQAASVSIHGPHRQYIENVHLQPFTSDQEFWDVLYTGPYSRLLDKAEDFLTSTGDNPEDTLVFISCGFDACEHEFASMSRHGRKVPVSFYHRFAQDACAFAERHAKGRLISVLEGGYSDLALMSGSMAHLSGLVDISLPSGAVNNQWWSAENLSKLENALKKRRAGKQSLNPSEKWLDRARHIFSSIDAPIPSSPPRAAIPIPPSSMTLRERKPKATGMDFTPDVSPQRSVAKKKGGRKSAAEMQSVVSSSASESSDSGTLVADSSLVIVTAKSDNGSLTSVPKILPRVILRVNPPNS